MSFGCLFCAFRQCCRTILYIANQCGYLQLTLINVVTLSFIVGYYLRAITHKVLI